jgi:hypothetical protein
MARNSSHDDLVDAPGTVNIDIGKTTLYYVLGHGGTSDEVIERSRSSAVN